jgi:hypothetical protein
LNKLETVLAQRSNDLSETLPLLAELLSIQIGERYRPVNLTPQKRKEKTLSALVAQVEGLSARQPVLMVFKDVHWSDPTSRSRLLFVIVVFVVVHIVSYTQCKRGAQRPRAINRSIISPVVKLNGQPCMSRCSISRAPL